MNEHLNKELLHSKQRFNDIFDNIGVAIWSYAKETDSWHVSAGFEQVYGYTREAFHLNPNLWKEVIHSDDIPLLNEHMKKLDSGISSDFEHRIITPTGEIRWVHCICTPVLDHRHEVMKVNGVVIDITEKKAAQRQLEENREMLQHILDAVDLGIWSYDYSSGKIQFASEGLTKITGYPSDMFIDLDSWKKIIYPDDLHIFEQVSMNIRQGLSDTSEYRIIHSSGQIRWVQNRINPKLEGAAIIRLDGVVIDISSRKKLEQDLAKSEAMYRLIAENMTDFLGTVDINGVVQYASPTYHRILGYDNEKMAGTSAFDYIHPDDVVNVTEILRKIQTPSITPARFRYVHADGYPVYVDSLCTPVVGDNGKIKSIIVVARDITEKVRS